MKITRKEYFACVSPVCGYGSPEEIQTALAARGFGKGDIDMAKLIRSWLDDKSMKKRTLSHCAANARKCCKVGVGGALQNPRKCLETVLARITAPPKPTTEG